MFLEVVQGGSALATAEASKSTRVHWDLQRCLTIPRDRLSVDGERKCSPVRQIPASNAETATRECS